LDLSNSFHFFLLVVQKLFKKQDKNNAAAIHKSDMKKILTAVLPEHSDAVNSAELEELLLQHVKGK
jgi:hypothetical protein